MTPCRSYCARVSFQFVHPHCFLLVDLQGAVCTERCQEGRYGPNCAEECVCHNRGKCDPETGQCQCAKGFTGNRCVCAGALWQRHSFFLHRMRRSKIKAILALKLLVIV